MVTTTDLVILAILGSAACLYLFRDTLFAKKEDSLSKLNGGILNGGEGDSDWLDKLKNQVSRLLRIKTGIQAEGLEISDSGRSGDRDSSGRRCSRSSSLSLPLIASSCSFSDNESELKTLETAPCR